MPENAAANPVASAGRDATRIVFSGIAIAMLIVVLYPWMEEAGRAGRAALETLLCVAMLLLSLVCYWIGCSTAARARRDMTPAVVVAAACVIAAGLMVWPFNGADVWTYVSFGWMEFRYHMSPYGHEIAEVPGYAHDPMLMTSVFEEVFPYGPLFAEFAKLVCRLSGVNPVHAVLLFKLANVVAAIGIAAMAASVAARLGSERRDVTVYLLLCHPLIAMEFFGEGHNDLLAAAPVVLAILFAERDWLMLVLPAIAIGALVKFLPALGAPFAFAYVARRRGTRAALASAALAAALCVVVAAPYLSGWTAPILRRTVQGQLASYQTLPYTIGYIVVKTLRLTSVWAVSQPARVYDVVAALAILAYAAFFISQCLSFARKRMPQLEDLIAATTLVLIVFICLARSKYDAWYVGMFLPIALMLGRHHWLSRAAIAIGFAGLLELALNYSAPIIDFTLLIGIPLAWSWWSAPSGASAAQDSLHGRFGSDSA
jgi:hypothetical protein